MVSVYSALDGFPKEKDQPRYYQLLRNVGTLTEMKDIQLIAAAEGQKILGAVVYFGDMEHYTTGIKIQEANTSGFRLLAVSPEARGKGVGRMLVQDCIDRATKAGHQQVIIHSTKSMMTAWQMYEKIGFKRSPDLDFPQGDMQVYGFRLKL